MTNQGKNSIPNQMKDGELDQGKEKVLILLKKKMSDGGMMESSPNVKKEISSNEWTEGPVNQKNNGCTLSDSSDQVGMKKSDQVGMNSG